MKKKLVLRRLMGALRERSSALAAAWASALVLSCALVPSAAADYKYAGQWAVPTEASSIAVGPSGIYVANSQSASTPAKVTRYSPDGGLTATWGGFETPRGLSVGPDGRVWVADGPGTVRVFTPDGAQVDERTLTDSCGEGRAVAINDLDADPAGDLYQTVYDNCDLEGEGSRRVVVRTTFPGWNVASVWGGLDGSANDGEFGLDALAVASDGRGNVYVTDGGNDRVQQFTPEGAFVRKWGQLGGAPGEFNSPSGIAIGPSGDLFVADRNNDRVQRFTPDGRFVEQFRVPDSATYAGAFTLDVDVDAQGRVYALTTDFATEDEVNVFLPAGGGGSASSVAIPKQKLRYRKGKIKVKLACTVPDRCKGKLSIRKGKRASLAEGRYSLAAGKRGKATAKATKKGRALLKRENELKVTVELRPKGGGPKVTKKLVLRT